MSVQGLNLQANDFAPGSGMSPIHKLNPETTDFLPLQSNFNAKAASEHRICWSMRKAESSHLPDASLEDRDNYTGPKDCHEEVRFDGPDHELAQTERPRVLFKENIDNSAAESKPLTPRILTQIGSPLTSFEEPTPVEDLLCIDASTEYQMQKFKIDTVGEEAHHVNWLGNPVFDKTATSPAISLCAILATPKKEFSDPTIDLRIFILLQNAFYLVDPILFKGDIQILNNFFGTKLQEMVIGSCYKFYNRFGFWHPTQYSEEDDLPIEDTMYISDYSADDIIINGWFNNSGIPTRNEFRVLSNELAKKYHATREPDIEKIPGAEGTATKFQVVKKPFVPSPLRQMLLHTDIEDISFTTSTKETISTATKPSVVGNEAKNLMSLKSKWDALPDLDDLYGPEDDDWFVQEEAVGIEKGQNASNDPMQACDNLGLSNCTISPTDVHSMSAEVAHPKLDLALGSSDSLSGPLETDSLLEKGLSHSKRVHNFLNATTASIVSTGSQNSTCQYNHSPSVSEQGSEMSPLSRTNLAAPRTLRRTRSGWNCLRSDQRIGEFSKSPSEACDLQREVEQDGSKTKLRSDLMVGSSISQLQIVHSASHDDITKDEAEKESPHSGTSSHTFFSGELQRTVEKSEREAFPLLTEGHAAQEQHYKNRDKNAAVKARTLSSKLQPISEDSMETATEALDAAFVESDHSDFAEPRPSLATLVEQRPPRPLSWFKITDHRPRKSSSRCEMDVCAKPASMTKKIAKAFKRFFGRQQNVLH